jgi:hypothetical protein
MGVQQLEIEGTWEEIAAQASRFAGRRLRLTILPDESENLTGPSEPRALEEKIAAIVAQVPDEEWEKLPPDMGDQLDHYIYGTPRHE